MDKQQPVDDQLNSPVAPKAESLPADSLPILSLEDWRKKVAVVSAEWEVGHIIL